ncbi:ATPase [Pseudoruegeria sp. SHC-113]|uniref:ATPase n=1 Tax=Pseudoruegeria sp. SHC-113 TaxID=2855439 RepID=UPI0021BB2A66|nr:ATPase [Pseudoruegeria sp. SHC-113]MCT8160407.1 ATPase [Pseudoruegeria sp. SHC-113]
MIYETARDWLNAKQKRILLFGMSGLGKTHVSNMLRGAGDWFHYSVDYRIGTRYMGEHIVDNFKAEAMRNPFLADLLRTDSIYIASNITFNNLAPLSTYLGKPGNPDKGGLPFLEYMRRQSLHRHAEINALLDTGHFIERAKALYGYDNFICDSGGSICEVVNPEDPEDEVLTALKQNTLMIWIEGSEAHTEELIRRFDRAPKPMYYQPEFLHQVWSEYLSENNVQEEDVDPNHFVRSAYARALAHRQPRYAAMAKHWGIKVTAEQVAQASTAEAFEALIAETLEAR